MDAERRCHTCRPSGKTAENMRLAIHSRLQCPQRTSACARSCQLNGNATDGIEAPTYYSGRHRQRAPELARAATAIIH
jgi:hypothetical protein